MDKNPSYVKMLAVMGIVCLLSAAVLGYVHTATYEKIEQNRKQSIKDAVYEVLPETTGYEKMDMEPGVFKGYKDGETTGYSFLVEGIGFQGTISLMVGMDTGIENITGIAVLESVETPGLGDRIKGADFLKQFEKLTIPDSDRITVDAITGATISSKAVEKIINRAIQNAKRIH